MFVRRLAVLSRGVQRTVQRRFGHDQAEIEKIPAHFRNLSYDDLPLPRGSWQARYDELQRKNNAFLAFSIVTFAGSIYFYIYGQEWVSCPDEPAERWYPVDRFKEGTGEAII